MTDPDRCPAGGDHDRRTAAGAAWCRRCGVTLDPRPPGVPRDQR